MNPDARIRARAPAMLRPWVTVRDLSSGIGFTPHEYGGVRTPAATVWIWLGYEATLPARDADKWSACRYGRLIPRSGNAEGWAPPARRCPPGRRTPGARPGPRTAGSRCRSCARRRARRGRWGRGRRGRPRPVPAAGAATSRRSTAAAASWVRAERMTASRGARVAGFSQMPRK